tara:strand:+ start:1254 stop:1691 length:438 start_codon:yes stop_codon:yes gene_type:complete
MAITFTNTFKNVLDALEGILEDEFKGALPVYKGNTVPKGVNQALQLIPTGSDLIEYNINSESREYSVVVRFIFAEVNVKETALDHILRYVSRIEALIHDNITMTLADSSNAYNCRFDSTELNADEESGVHITEWQWKCSHSGNFD